MRMATSKSNRTSRGEEVEIKPLRGIVCKSCGTIVCSMYNHDFKTCECGKVSVDGGQDSYWRIIGSRKDYLVIKLKPKK